MYCYGFVGRREISKKKIWANCFTGIFPLPFAAAYSGSKAGLEQFAHCQRLALKRHNVGVTLIVPGFVDTPMSREITHRKPFLVPIDEAVNIISEAIHYNRAYVIFPFVFRLLRRVYYLLPGFITDKIMRALATKW